MVVGRGGGSISQIVHWLALISGGGDGGDSGYSDERRWMLLVLVLVVTLV